ncbi:MAG: hypothetical protein LBS05_00125 [Tannerellaceae bacterium]|jgi:hypothetical protein|nr:hypothetical protein [Tannerellaceae bacterium]
MESGRIGLEAANLLLDRGIRFTLTGAPFFLRLFGLHRFHIRPLRAGTIVEIYRLMHEHALNDIKTEAEANASVDKIALVVATAVLNDRRRLRWQKGVAALFCYHIPAAELFKIYMIIARLSSVADFMTITGYFRLQAQTMMRAKIPGQRVKGS